MMPLDAMLNDKKLVSKKLEGEVFVGEVVGTEGTEGALCLRSYTSQAKDILGYGALFEVGNVGAYEFSLLGVMKRRGMLRVRCAGVKTKEQAEGMLGKKLYANRAYFPDADDGEIYYWDLIGLVVRDEGDKTLGVISSVEDHGAGAIIIWKRESGEEEMHPYASMFFGDVDKLEGSILYKGS